MRRVLTLALLAFAVAIVACDLGHLNEPVETECDSGTVRTLNTKRAVLLGYSIAGPESVLPALDGRAIEEARRMLASVFATTVPYDIKTRVVEPRGPRRSTLTWTAEERARIGAALGSAGAEVGVLAFDAYGFIEGTGGGVADWVVVNHTFIFDGDGKVLWTLSGELSKANLNPFTLDKLKDLLLALFMAPAPADLMEKHLLDVCAARWTLTQKVLLDDMTGQKHANARGYLPNWGRDAAFVSSEPPEHPAVER